MKWAKAAFCLLPFLSLAVAAPQQAKRSGYVTTSGTTFQLDGNEFAFLGMNAYWLAQLSSTDEINKAFSQMQEIGVKVARTWAFDMVTSDNGGTYYQLWSGSSYTTNTGSTGLERLDAVVNAAGSYGIKLIMTIIQSYESYVNTVVSRYKNSANIFAWELANEPRANGYPENARPGFSASDLTKWVADRSAFIKSIDSNHMVCVGDEGYFNWAGQTDYIYDGDSGGDFDATLKLPTIDFGTFHLYPEDWGKSPTLDWGNTYIQQHGASGKAAGKPVIMEEFNVKTEAEQVSILPQWIDTAINADIVGIMPWGLGSEGYSGFSTGGGADSYDLYPGKSDVWNILKDTGTRMNGGSVSSGGSTTTSSSAAPTQTTGSSSSGNGSSSCEVGQWNQCGGALYSGCTTCASGTTCSYYNYWFWRCV